MEPFLRIRIDGPDEVGEEAAPEDDDEDGQVGPEVEPAVGEKLGLGECGDGLAGVEAEGEEGAHEAGEDGDGDALAEGVVALAGFGLLFGGDFVLLGVAGGAVDGDADEADEDAEEDDLAGGLVEEGADLAVVDGRNKGAEEGAEAEGDGVSQRDAEVADGEAEGDAADAPEDARRGWRSGCCRGRVRRPVLRMDQTCGTKMLASSEGAMIQAAKPWMIQ